MDFVELVCRYMGLELEQLADSMDLDVRVYKHIGVVVVEVYSKGLERRGHKHKEVELLVLVGYNMDLVVLECRHK